VPAWRVVPVPLEIPPDTAAALMLQGCTAHYLTHSTFVLGFCVLFGVSSWSNREDSKC
jgi:NADPH:quinone reductase-like Zn-dependent oxidoreductase